MATKTGKGLTVEELVEACFNKDVKTLVTFGVRGMKRTAEYIHAVDQEQRTHQELVQRELIEVFKRLGQPPTWTPQANEPEARPHARATSDGGLADELNQQHQRIREEREAMRRRRAIVREELELERERQHLEAEETALRDLREGKTPEVSPDDLPPPPSPSAPNGVIPPVKKASKSEHPEDDIPLDCAPLVAEALNIIMAATQRGDEDREESLSSYEAASECLRQCTSSNSEQEATIRDVHANALFHAIAACAQLKLVGRWQGYIDELVRVSTHALETEFSPERVITFARALQARGDFALATDKIDEAESLFIAARDRVRAVAPQGDADNQVAMATLIELGRRLDAIQARRDGELH